MGNPPNDEERSTAVLTRVGAAASRLGIETFWLEAAAKRLGTAPGRYLRVWVDTDMPRLVMRAESRDALEARPARARYVELDSAGGEYELAVGTRPFAEDRQLIASVPATALDQVAEHLDALGDGRCDALGRIVGGTAWTMTLVEADGGNLPASAARLGTLAGELGVTPLQRSLLEQSHLVLGVRGYTATLTCDRTGMRSGVTLEYRHVGWPRVIGLTDALRPGTSSDVALGVFAGAMGAGDTASGMAITYRAGQTAHVRIAVDHESELL
jgi:hypothetical protein